ncbi:MAG TPA: branched-chain amino acid ABC transporter permease [Sporichthya sp.]|nr:branched-chain amino acid ABC transporter permease [Sporichthya sp.]
MSHGTAPTTGGHVPSKNGSHPTIAVPPRVGGPGSSALDRVHGMLGIHPGLLLLVAALVLYPLIGSDYWVNNVSAGLVLAISALGLLVVVGWGREISLTQAGLTGSALYISGYAARGGNPGESGWDLPFPLAAGVGILFAVAVSALVALVAMRLAGVYVIVLTLSLQFLIENSLFTEEKLTGGLSSPVTPRPEVLGMKLSCNLPCTATLSSDDRIYYFILAFLLVSMYFLYRFRNSRFGRSMIMVGVDQAAAAAVGVSPWKYKVAAFAVGGFFAGLGGALLAPLYGNPPGVFEYNSFNSLFYLSIPIMAGFESLMAVVAVALLFRLLPQILLEFNFDINGYLLGGLGLALGILMGPRGVGGRISDIFDSRARTKRKAARASASRNAAGGGGAPPRTEARVPATAGSESK